MCGLVSVMFALLIHGSPTLLYRACTAMLYVEGWWLDNLLQSYAVEGWWLDNICKASKLSPQTYLHLAARAMVGFQRHLALRSPIGVLQMESILDFEIQISLHSAFCDPRALEACWSGRCVTSLEVAACEVQAFRDDFWIASCPALFPKTHISHRGLHVAREIMWPEPIIPNPKSHAPLPKP